MLTVRKHAAPAVPFPFVRSALATACLLTCQSGNAAASENSVDADATQLREMVVTGRRTATRLEDTPQRIEVIDAKDIERTPARDLTDLLKKNSSVDVIQYESDLSGIGIRGFRPEFSGINKRSLLLIDGRPGMSTNLSIVDMGLIQRVEVLKGPASALYGSSAMGGVVNLISRESRGALNGSGQITLGENSRKEVRGRIGGKLSEALDFDYAGNWQDQGDFTMGNGEVRPNTSFTQQYNTLRLGAQLNADWRLSVKADNYKGRDIATPGDLAYGTTQQSNKDMDRSSQDMRLTGSFGKHLLTVTGFAGEQSQAYNTKNAGTAPYKSFEDEQHWHGLQAQDVWAWSDIANLVFGVDVESAKVISRSFNTNGTQKGPFSANNKRDTTGVYAENTWTLSNDNSIFYVGLRNDRIRVETLITPFKTGFAPSTANFSTTNPSAGFKQVLGGGFGLHGTIGKGFVVPDASQLTGNTVSVSGGTTTTTLGNAGLKPESSLTWDLGLEWGNDTLHTDVTVFDTKVRDKIANVRTVTAPNTVLSTYVNAASARMQGLELDARWKATSYLTLSMGGTRMFHAYETPGNSMVDINNVPKLTVRLAADVDMGDWSGRVGLRYVGQSKDIDYVHTGALQVQYAGYTVADLSTRYQIDRHQSIQASVDNLFDRFYSEKYGFPQPGRNLKVSYRYDF